MTERTLSAGSTLLLPGTHQNPDNRHLCIVLNDPRKEAGNQALYVPVITVRRKFDATCILDVGDHPFIRHPSCVHYATMSQRSEAHLLKVGTIQEPLREEVLQRVLEGATASPHSPPWAKKFFLDD